jgi:hypothetical protein
MVKVVGLDESAVKRITCVKCASILEYTESEVQWIKHSQDYLGIMKLIWVSNVPNATLMYSHRGADD